MLVVAGDVDADAIEAKITHGFPIEVPGLSVSRVESFAAWDQPDPAARILISARSRASTARGSAFFMIQTSSPS